MKILFVDEDLFFAQPYLETLQKKADVFIRNNALDAVDEMQNKSHEYGCVVQDIMMPAPEGWDVKTQDGLDTGIEILKVCREEIIKAKLPILVLTNRALGYTKHEIDMIDFPDGQVIVRSKIETPAFLLSIQVSQLVEKWKAGSKGGSNTTGPKRGPK